MVNISSQQSEQLVEQIVALKKTLGQFTRLIEISLTLNSTLDQSVILQSIIETATDVIECEAVSILLYNQERDELHFVASTDSQPEKLTRIPVPINDSIAGTIFTTNTPQIINTLSGHPQHYKYISEKLHIENRSLVGVPMRIRDEVIGVIEGINKRQGKFTQEDADILSVIASQAAVAINNARMIESLQAAYRELSQIDRIKTEFISIASHELRTPLFHILGYAELLEQDADEKHAENLQQVLKSARMLQSLVEDMTNMNMLESRSHRLVSEQISLQHLLKEAYQEAADILQDKQLHVSWALPKTTLQVHADPEKLRLVFVNVFKNAARFTPIGGRVDVQLKQVNDQAEIAISDNGIGIPPGQLEAIFDRMRQLESHTTRSSGGLGLGLPIARGLVELHHGRIWAESAGKNKGTTIRCTLPLASVPPFLEEYI